MSKILILLWKNLIKINNLILFGWPWLHALFVGVQMAHGSFWLQVGFNTWCAVKTCTVRVCAVCLYDLRVFRMWSKTQNLKHLKLK